MTVLKTARLVLRPLASGDIDWISTTINDLEISGWLTQVPYPYSYADGEDFFVRVTAGEMGSVWVICERDERLGMISVGNELGYWLATGAWGRGVMSEAGQAVVDHAFSQTDRSEIRSSHFVGNDRSRAVLAKLGFDDVGDHVHHSFARDEDVPGRSMRLTREAWQSLRSPAQ